MIPIAYMHEKFICQFKYLCWYAAQKMNDWVIWFCEFCGSRNIPENKRCWDCGRLRDYE